MPCDSITVQTVSTALSKAIPELVLAALKDRYWEIQTGNTATNIVATKYNDRLEWTAGKGVTIRSNTAQADIKEITQAYSKAAVSWAAQRAGFKVTASTGNKMTLRR